MLGHFLHILLHPFPSWRLAPLLSISYSYQISPYGNLSPQVIKVFSSDYVFGGISPHHPPIVESINLCPIFHSDRRKIRVDERNLTVKWSQSLGQVVIPNFFPNITNDFWNPLFLKSFSPLVVIFFNPQQQIAFLVRGIQFRPTIYVIQSGSFSLLSQIWNVCFDKLQNYFTGVFGENVVRSWARLHSLQEFGCHLDRKFKIFL